MSRGFIPGSSLVGRMPHNETSHPLPHLHHLLIRSVVLPHGRKPPPQFYPLPIQGCSPWVQVFLSCGEGESKFPKGFGHLHARFAAALTMTQHMKVHVGRRRPGHVPKSRTEGRLIPVPCRPVSCLLTTLFIHRVPEACLAWHKAEEDIVLIVNGHRSLLANNEWISQHLGSS